MFQSMEEDWFEQALDYTARPVHGDAALPQQSRRTPRSRSADHFFRLADYMEQHGRRTRRAVCPPASFWEAALHHLSRPNDIDALAWAASSRWRLRYARLLAARARQLPLPESVTESATEPLDDEWRDVDAVRPANHLTCRALADLARIAVDEGDYEQAAALALQAAECCQPDKLATTSTGSSRYGYGCGHTALSQTAPPPLRPVPSLLMARPRGAPLSSSRYRPPAHRVDRPRVRPLVA
ncbi:hypothetical protein [Streptomyces sp. URMC 123]|uniref:hypothetical protein n=1 Tax=Streptomyces sp. URMC 123 TaxID=3423403 RepID=UPI003F1AA096